MEAASPPARHARHNRPAQQKSQRSRLRHRGNSKIKLIRRAGPKLLDKKRVWTGRQRRSKTKRPGGLVDIVAHNRKQVIPYVAPRRFGGVLSTGAEMGVAQI